MCIQIFFQRQVQMNFAPQRKICLYGNHLNTSVIKIMIKLQEKCKFLPVGLVMLNPNGFSQWSEDQAFHQPPDHYKDQANDQWVGQVAELCVSDVPGAGLGVNILPC